MMLKLLSQGKGQVWSDCAVLLRREAGAAGSWRIMPHLERGRLWGKSRYCQWNSQSFVSQKKNIVIRWSKETIKRIVDEMVAAVKASQQTVYNTLTSDNLTVPCWAQIQGVYPSCVRRSCAQNSQDYLCLDICLVSVYILY